MDKTELMWTCTKHNLSKILGCSLALTLGGAHVSKSDHGCGTNLQKIFN